ncbi:MAG: DedA family protein [Acidobacteria bacterium]|nr:DedA family protein [Acidobacteriota bacterium]
MWLLVGLAFSTLVSEDLALLTAGALVAQGEVNLPAAILACIAGIFGGDLLLYLAGRLGGRWLFRSSWVRPFVSKDAVVRAADWMGDNTFTVVFLSRFTPGLRLPVYVATGLLNRNFFKFALALLLAALVWTPLVVVSGALFGETMESFTLKPAVKRGNQPA